MSNDKPVPSEFGPEHAAIARNREGFVHGVDLVVIFVANVDVSAAGPNEEGRQDHTLDDQVGSAQQELAVLEGRRLALVGVADDVLLVAAGLEDVSPFLRGRSAGSAHAAQVGLLELGDQARAHREPVALARGGRQPAGEFASGLVKTCGSRRVSGSPVGVDAPGSGRAVDRVGAERRGPRDARRRSCAGGAAKSTVDGRSRTRTSSGVPWAVQLDQGSRRTIAAPEAGDTLDLDPGVATELAGNGLERLQGKPAHPASGKRCRGRRVPRHPAAVSGGSAGRS